MTPLAQIRFGYGPSASDGEAPSHIGPAALLAQISQPDQGAVAYERPGLAERFRLAEEHTADTRRRRKENDTSPRPPDAPGTVMKEIFRADQLAFVLRPVAARHGFAERLANFWANRLTVGMVGSGGLFIEPFRHDVARAHLAGRYEDMLRTALWHPAMLLYLDQNRSIGPQSNLGQRKGLGLNENLAREFLELHSMGTGYDQTDVTELARLMAGMKHDRDGPGIRSAAVEPGTKRILGQRFGDDDPMAEINRMVAMVAARPETARSVAQRLATHFISDTPPEDLVAQLTRSYLDEGGYLPALYRVLLDHPAAWAPTLSKLRSPQEYVAACLRALGLTGQETALPGLHRRQGFRLPEVMLRMGQPIFRPRGPDGWPETAEDWLTAPMMAARIDFAVDAARAGAEGADPTAVAERVLGPLASPTLRFAIQGAEQRWEGVAVLLGSPEFMRR